MSDTKIEQKDIQILSHLNFNKGRTTSEHCMLNYPL